MPVRMREAARRGREVVKRWKHGGGPISEKERQRDKEKVPRDREGKWRPYDGCRLVRLDYGPLNPSLYPARAPEEGEK